MKILIRGAGDLASGVAAELFEAGHQVIMTEIKEPLTVRRQVSFSQAVYSDEVTVEGITGKLVKCYEEAEEVLRQHQIPVIVDPDAKIRDAYAPDVLVDAILAKKNIGTKITDAPCVIALGPGFEGGKDCYAVIETMRGETLGRPIYDGKPIPNTGVPGIIGGYGLERLIKASADGKMKAASKIGDIVKKGDVLAYTGGMPVYALIDGIIRGMLQDGLIVKEGMKIGDVDPRTDESLVYLISDKSRKIGRGVKEAIDRYFFSDAGIILMAAGLSSRYGSNKLLAEVEDKPMFLHAAEKMEEFPKCERVIVTRFPEIEAYAEAHDIRVAVNDRPEEGITRSIRLGIQTLLEEKPEIRGAVFMVADQPNLSRDTIERLLILGKCNPDRIICAAFEGKRGNPVYWDRCFFDELMSLSGDVGGRQIMQKYQDKILLCQIPEIELKDVDKPNSK